MKIGVISDTHSKGIPAQVLKDFKDVEFIIHAGDFCSLNDVKVLNKVKPVKAVWGNMDDSVIRQMFPETQLIEWNGFTIGVYHGTGPRTKVIDFVKVKFAKEKVDAIIFGHSHEALNQVIDGVLYFNPGSPNDDFAPSGSSYGFLEIKNNKLVGSIVKVKTDG